uniref:Uncharacterized protein n=1 Tax=Rhizophora mucronata TaxID=61149 RepID=A0A2P2P5N7_RHIMU
MPSGIDKNLLDYYVVLPYTQTDPYPPIPLIEAHTQPFSVTEKV